MIPPFNASMVLPPFMGDNPGIKAAMSPYRTDILSLVRRFATSASRAQLLTGLLAYRKALVSAGISDGFQWIDGSFVEDVETKRGRPPGDIDLVTFATSPVAASQSATEEEFSAWVGTHGDLFDPGAAKNKYHCEAFFVDFRKRPDLLVDDTRYWFGLFSHQRQTSLWKGMVQVPLVSNDVEAEEFLRNVSFERSEIDHA